MHPKSLSGAFKRTMVKQQLGNPHAWLQLSCKFSNPCSQLNTRVLLDSDSGQQPTAAQEPVLQPVLIWPLQADSVHQTGWGPGRYGKPVGSARWVQDIRPTPRTDAKYIYINKKRSRLGTDQDSFFCNKRLFSSAISHICYFPVAKLTKTTLEGEEVLLAVSQTSICGMPFCNRTKSCSVTCWMPTRVQEGDAGENGQVTFCQPFKTITQLWNCHARFTVPEEDRKSKCQSPLKCTYLHYRSNYRSVRRATTYRQIHRYNLLKPNTHAWEPDQLNRAKNLLKDELQETPVLKKMTV